MRRSHASTEDSNAPSSFGNLPRRLVAHLMAREQPSVLHDVEPLRLALHVLGDAVALAARCRETRSWPAPRASNTSSWPDSTRAAAAAFGATTAVRFRSLPGRGLNLRRIHQPVAAHPHAVIGLRQIGHEVAAAIVGDHDLDELGRQVGRFRDDPDARFRPLRAGDHTAEIPAADADSVGGLGARPAARRSRDDNADRHHAAYKRVFRASFSDVAE